jgi:hypothetical protein
VVIPFIQSGSVREAQARESSGQKELLHAILAKQHLKNKCGRESSSTLQRGQKETAKEMGKMDLSLALVGMISQAIFHKNNLSPTFNFNFHRCFQELESRGEG